MTPQTVQALQLWFPRIANSDREAIAIALQDRSLSSGGYARYKLFPGIQNTEKRSELLERLLRSSRILSFHSFFEDTIYLEVCHNSLRNVLTARQSYKESFETAFHDIFDGVEESFHRCYIQLWLFAMRHFPELSDIAASRPRKEARLPKPRKSGPTQSRIEAFAIFAEGLGFRSLQTKKQFYRRDQVIDSDVLIAARAPSSSTDVSDVPFKARSNRPFERSFSTDRKYLFLKYVIPEPEPPQHEFITTFAIARDFLCSFWDIGSLQLAREHGHQSAFEDLTADTPMPDSPQRPSARAGESVLTKEQLPTTLPKSPHAVNVDSSRKDESVKEAADDLNSTMEAKRIEELSEKPGPRTTQTVISSDLTGEAIDRREEEEALYEEDLYSPSPFEEGPQGPSVKDTEPLLSEEIMRPKNKRPADQLAMDTEKSSNILERVLVRLEAKHWCVVDEINQVEYIRTDVGQAGRRELHRILDPLMTYRTCLLLYSGSGKARNISSGEGSENAWRALQSSTHPKILQVSPKAPRHKGESLPISMDGTGATLVWQRTAKRDISCFEIHDEFGEVLKIIEFKTGLGVYDARMTEVDTLKIEISGIGVTPSLKFECRKENWERFVGVKGGDLIEKSEEL